MLQPLVSQLTTLHISPSEKATPTHLPAAAIGNAVNDEPVSSSTAGASERRAVVASSTVGSSSVGSATARD